MLPWLYSCRQLRSIKSARVGTLPTRSCLGTPEQKIFSPVVDRLIEEKVQFRHPDGDLVLSAQGEGFMRHTLGRLTCTALFLCLLLGYAGSQIPAKKSRTLSSTTQPASPSLDVLLSGGTGYAPANPAPPRTPSNAETLLDEVGHLRTTVSYDQVLAWKKVVHRAAPRRRPLARSPISIWASGKWRI